MRFLKYILFALVVSCQSFSQNKDKKNEVDKDKLILFILKGVLSQGHYVEKDINDEFSEKIYDEFLKSLDPGKRYFTKEDLKEFSQFKHEIDDEIRDARIDFFQLVYKRFLEKIDFAKTTYRTILQQPFEYDKNETVDVDSEKLEYAKNEKKLIGYWRKRLKLSVLSRIEEIEEEEARKIKKDSTYKLKTFDDIEHQARTETLKNMDELYERIEELELNDWYSTFLNSITNLYDPHTMYMSPRIKSDFDQSMAGKIEGIGARLTKKGMYTEVVELISGGPAMKQGELEPGDKILKVGQGDSLAVDIVGMRLYKAIKHIKGKKGTEVRLTVKKKLDGSTKVIPIVRDVVEFEETFVKSSVVMKNGKKYGIIDLPMFYIDFKDRTARTSSSDMEKEIERLNKEGVEGLILDLRGNGGGSLKTAIEIAGLFIKNGPVVQVKYREKNARVRNDNDSRIQWKKPLVILVDEISASASEILAGAMQDYGRAIIMGSKQTYGKGTVQNITPLNIYLKNYHKDLGSLKFTIQKFYRINGESTQIKGVASDIVMPTRFNFMDYGERDYDNPLPWDTVQKARFQKVDSYVNKDIVIKNSEKRIEANPMFKNIKDYAKWLKSSQDKNEFSLNYKEFIKESKQKTEKGKEFKELLKFESKNVFKSPQYELKLEKTDENLKEKRDAWHKNLKKDVYVDEALNVLSELKMKK